MGIIGRLEKGKNLERTIEDMNIGEKAYVTPQSLAFDLDEIPYLNLGSTICKQPGGTIELPITRTGDSKVDYQVDIRNINYKWKKSSNPFSSVVGVEESKIVQLYYETQLEKKDQRIEEFQGVGDIPYNPNEYPTTWEIRKNLNTALGNEHYELAAKLRDKINNSPEPLK